MAWTTYEELTTQTKYWEVNGAARKLQLNNQEILFKEK